MRLARLLALYALLVIGAVYAALRARNPEPTSTVPSVDNSGPRGLGALFLYLREAGYDARAHHEALSELPTDTQTVVLSAPVAREIDEAERKALAAFVEHGGTLVYLVPTTGGKPEQEALWNWLSLHSGDWERPVQLSTERTLTVWQARGPFTGIQRLRTSAPRALRVEASGALPVAGDGDEVLVWFLPMTKGEIYIFSGADTAQNRWIESEDNLRLWEQIARRGPIAFDEYHHHPAPLPPPSLALGATLGQLAFLVLLLFWARGVRLGPPRPTLVERHRSTREYLLSFGQLLNRAGVEAELVSALHRRVRRRLWEEAGIPTSASDVDAAVRWSLVSGEPPDRFRRWADGIRAAEGGQVSPAQFAHLSVEAALLERSGR